MPSHPRLYTLHRTSAFPYAGGDCFVLITSELLTSTSENTYEPWKKAILAVPLHSQLASKIELAHDCGLLPLLLNINLFIFFNYGSI